jgi:hypothetical protein
MFSARREEIHRANTRTPGTASTVPGSAFDLAKLTTRLYDIANALWHWAPPSDPARTIRRRQRQARYDKWFMGILRLMARSPAGTLKDLTGKAIQSL